MTKKISLYQVLFFMSFIWMFSCKTPAIISKSERKDIPGSYSNAKDTVNAASINWRNYFTDPYLNAIIDTALKNNQELNIALQEIEMDQNEIMARKGEYMPFVNLGAASSVERSGKFTFDGQSEEALKGTTEKGHKYLGDFMVGAYASWELDIWKKLRNARKSAVLKYLSTIEGRNFMVTNIIAEISSSYYELIALDNLLSIIQQNIEIQNNALQVVILQKEAAKASQLAINRFDAQLLNTKNLQFEIQQRIVETENKINYLAGRFPQHIPRSNIELNKFPVEFVHSGVPSQLLANRPDIRQAELDLEAAKLDVQVARANFYPSVRLTAGLGLNAYNPIYILQPQSILYNLGADMIAPLINKNAIKATYFNANLKQTSAVFNYERSILNGYIEVVNQLSMIDNYSKSYETKAKEVDILTQSIGISNDLFRYARADYIEVLLTQREALDSKIELIEIKLKQMQAKVNIYKALGGGWN